MELQAYFRMILKRGWIIIVLAVITAASAFIFSKVQRPVYRATLYLNAIPARMDWGLQQAIKNILRNYSRQIVSDSTLSRVDELLQLDMSPDMMRADITADPIESDLLIQISVDNYDPMTAKNIADTMADVFVADMGVRMLDQNQEDRVDVYVNDYARPGSLFKPKWKVNTLAGAVFGAMLGLLIIFVLEWLEADVIRSQEDVERYITLPVLGQIPVLAAQPSSGGSAHQQRGQASEGK